MNSKEKALKKIELELNKDIDLAIDLAKSCRFLEFAYFIYRLRLVRLIHLFPKVEVINDDLLKAVSNSTEDSFKYIIALISKYGHLRILKSSDSNKQVLNLELVQFFIKHVNSINSKYESKLMIQLFDVQVSGERDQHIRVDMSKLSVDPEVTNYFNYYLRIDTDNDIKKSLKENLQILIINFKKEYNPILDLFIQELGITVDEFCWLNEQLVNKVTNCILEKEDLMEKLPNGKIDFTSQITFLHFIRCFIYKKNIVPKFPN